MAAHLLLAMTEAFSEGAVPADQLVSTAVPRLASYSAACCRAIESLFELGSPFAAQVAFEDRLRFQPDLW